MDDDKKNTQDNNKNKNASSGPRIVTLASMRSNEDSEREAFFAGGSLTSGQQILGNDTNNQNSNQIRQQVMEFFRAASISNDQRSDINQESRQFPGTGHTLGSTELTLGSVESANNEAIGASSVVEQPTPTNMTLKLWENGYTVNDGPLIIYDGQNSEDIIRKIVSGLGAANQLNHQIDLTVVDNTSQQHIETLSSFSGTGHVLGGLTPTLTTLEMDNPSFREAVSPFVEGLNLNAENEYFSANTDNSPGITLSNCGLIVPQHSGISNLPEDLNEEFSNNEYASSLDFDETPVELCGIQGCVPNTQNTPPDHQVNASRELPSPQRITFNVTSNTDFSDGAERITTLKIRLPDSQTVRLTVNSSSIISQIKEYIKQCIPNLAGTSFSLHIFYPSRELQNDESVDSEEIGNTVLNLRIIF